MQQVSINVLKYDTMACLLWSVPFWKAFSIVMTLNTFGDVTTPAANSLDDFLSLYIFSYFILNFEKNSK